ncbi:RTA1 like protein-domain-containing protein [Tricladium varicosporioides]|nr:RTA1 like protein-domain-containing protein [Hymenoscyphus varicosporioides]
MSAPTTTSFNFNPSTTATTTATPTCFSAVPDKNGYVPYGSCGANYLYYPSFGGAVAFAILFGISLFLHIFQAFTFKKWKLCWVVIMGVAWEFISFATRAAGAKLQQSVALATVNQLLFLLAPIWINAFIYMIMGRMIYFFIPEQKIWGVKGMLIGRIFVWLDIISFLTQVGGGLLIQPSNDEKTILTGIHVYMGGIGFQEFCIILFTAIAVKFYLVMAERERDNASSSGDLLDTRPTNWRWLLYVLFATLALITARIIYRIVEFAAGLDPAKNRLPYVEAYNFALDALPMLLAVLLLNLVHPGRILQGEGSEFPKGPSRKEKRAAKVEKRLAAAEKKAIKNAAKRSKYDSVPAYVHTPREHRRDRRSGQHQHGGAYA